MMEKDYFVWYQENIICFAKPDKAHNYIPVNFIQTQYTKQATTLMCSHCLQILEFKDVQEFNYKANSLETSENV